MREDINVRIIKKLKENKYNKILTDCIIKLIREEFTNRTKSRWNFSEVYDKIIATHSKEYASNNEIREIEA